MVLYIIVVSIITLVMFEVARRPYRRSGYFRVKKVAWDKYSRCFNFVNCRLYEIILTRKFSDTDFIVCVSICTSKTMALYHCKFCANCVQIIMLTIKYRNTLPAFLHKAFMTTAHSAHDKPHGSYM